MQWRPQEIRDVKNTEYLLRKSTDTEQSQPKREACYMVFALWGLCLALVLLFFILSLHFIWGIFVLCHCTLEVFNFLFVFYRGSQLKVCLESQRRLWTWDFQQSGTVKILIAHRHGANTFYIKSGHEMFGG